LPSRLGIRASLLAAAVAIGLAACGGNGGGGGTETGDGRLTEAEFVRTVNGICEEYDQEIEGLGDPQSADDVADYVESAVPIIRRGVAELRGVRPPEELEQRYDQMVDGVEASIPVIRRLADAARANDAKAAQEAIEEGERIDRNSDRVAEELGLDTCASNDQDGQR
jgi:hypothetical protein